MRRLKAKFFLEFSSQAGIKLRLRACPLVHHPPKLRGVELPAVVGDVGDVAVQVKVRVGLPFDRPGRQVGVVALQEVAGDTAAVASGILAAAKPPHHQRLDVGGHRLMDGLPHRLDDSFVATQSPSDRNAFRDRPGQVDAGAATGSASLGERFKR